jgi:Icc-related predicted phosphoesterase
MLAHSATCTQPGKQSRVAAVCAIIMSPMARLLVFSDIHNDARALDRLMDIEADFYFAAGDLVSWARGLDKMGAVMKRRAERVYVLPGNHESAADISSFCKRFGFTDFHGATLEIAGVHVAGLGYSTPTPFDTPGEWSEQEMALRLEKFGGLKPLVMICHAPPLNTPLDRIREGLHAGSRAVTDFIETQQPAHFFCGHIHEAEGVVFQMAATRAQNVGKKGYLLEL